MTEPENAESKPEPTAEGALESSPLTAALARVQEHLPKINKGKTAKVRMKSGGEYSYKYADLSDISPAVLPLLAAEGLTWVTKPTTDAAGDFGLRYTLKHVSGEKEEGWYPLTHPRNATPQEIGSFITYARRYTLCCVVGIAADEDDDAQMAQAGAKQQKAAATTDAARTTVNLRPYLEKTLNAEERKALGEAWTVDWKFKTTEVPRNLEAKARTLIDSYAGTLDPGRAFDGEPEA